MGVLIGRSCGPEKIAERCALLSVVFSGVLGLRRGCPIGSEEGSGSESVGCSSEVVPVREMD